MQAELDVVAKTNSSATAKVPDCYYQRVLWVFHKYFPIWPQRISMRPRFFTSLPGSVFQPENLSGSALSPSVISHWRM